MRSLGKVLSLVLVLFFLASLITLLPTAVKAQSKTIVVPDDCPTIQAAIDNASQGDTIFVKSGTYYETLAINKSINLIGEGQKTTFIDANNATENIIYINASYVSIENFTISNNKGYPYSVTEPDGIRAEYFSSNINITNNTISSIQYGNGISLLYSSGNTIVGNNITNCGGTGVFVGGGSDCGIIDNNIVNNGFGASLSYASGNNTIIGNYFGNSTYSPGLQIDNDCSNNTVVGNTFAFNQYGLALEPPSSNTFYHNNFIQNTFQVLLFGRNSDWAGLVNHWDNGKEGNYWSDYQGAEIGQTGIGDSPYPLIANWDGTTVYLDNYPLISQFNSSSSYPTPTPTPTPSPTPTPTASPTPSLTPVPSLSPTPSPTPVPEQITFSSGLIVYSPLNKVYNSYTVFCNASLQVPYGYQSEIIYSLDGVEQNSSNFKLNFGRMGKYHVDGAFMLPPLNNGPHQLIFNIQIELFNYSGPPPSSDFKPKVTSYGVKYYEAEYENTVNFSVYSTEPIPTPTPTMTTLPPSATPFPSNRNAPHFDLIYYLIPASVIGAIVVLSVLALRKHRKSIAK